MDGFARPQSIRTWISCKAEERRRRDRHSDWGKKRVCAARLVLSSCEIYSPLFPSERAKS